MALRASARQRLILQRRLAIGIAAATVKEPPESASALREFAGAALIRAFDARAGRAERLREFAFRIVGTGQKFAVAPVPLEQIRAAFLAFFICHLRRGLDDGFAVFAFGDFARRLAFRIAGTGQK